MKTKRFLGVVLSVVMILSLFPVALLAADGVACGVDGCGGTYTNGFCSVDSTHYEAPKRVSESHHPELNSTHNGYYAIENAGQLYWFAKIVNEQNASFCDNIEEKSYSYKITKDYFVTVSAVLTDNITVNNSVIGEDGKLVSDTSGLTEWTPIGNASTIYWSGSFDGNKYTVSGLYVDGYGTSASSTGKKYVGLIGNSQSGKISNVTVKDSYFSAYEKVGGIVGSLWGTTADKGSLANCVNYALVKGYQYEGGIAGQMGYATASDCCNYGSVEGGSTFVGGFAGQIYSAVNVSHCANMGDVTCYTGATGGFAGGAFGYNTNLWTYIENCYSIGNVKNTINSSIAGTYAGGFVGDAGNADIKNCYFSGTVNISKAASDKVIVGAFIGDAVNTNIQNCYYNNENITAGGSAVTVGIGNDAGTTVIAAKTTEQFASGEVAYLLGEAWGQTLNTDDYPLLGDDKVYKYVDGYSNHPYGFVEISEDKKTVKVNIAKAGTYTLVLADYEENRLNNLDTITVVSENDNTITTVTSEKDITLGTGDKIMLWSDLESFVPLCGAMTVE